MQPFGCCSVGKERALPPLYYKEAVVFLCIKDTSFIKLHSFGLPVLWESKIRNYFLLVTRTKSLNQSIGTNSIQGLTIN